MNSVEDPVLSYECDREAEIDRLRADNERLRGLIRQSHPILLSVLADTPDGPRYIALRKLVDHFNAALGEGER